MADPTEPVPFAKPRPDRRKFGVAEREPAEDTPEALEGEADEIGIEIDHASQRPQSPNRS